MLFNRAKFSEITQVSIKRALQNLCEPDKAISDAVDVRSELDLRIGIRKMCLFFNIIYTMILL